MVIAAVTSQAAISRAGEPTLRLISAGTMKMPEPIIDPTTIAVALKRPSPCTRCVPAEDAGFWVVGLLMDTSVCSTGKPLLAPCTFAKDGFPFLQSVDRYEIDRFIPTILPSIRTIGKRSPNILISGRLTTQ